MSEVTVSGYLGVLLGASDVGGIGGEGAAREMERRLKAVVEVWRQKKRVEERAAREEGVGPKPSRFSGSSELLRWRQRVEEAEERERLLMVAQDKLRRRWAVECLRCSFVPPSTSVEVELSLQESARYLGVDVSKLRQVERVLLEVNRSRYESVVAVELLRGLPDPEGMLEVITELSWSPSGEGDKEDEDPRIRLLERMINLDIFDEASLALRWPQMSVEAVRGDAVAQAASKLSKRKSSAFTNKTGRRAEPERASRRGKGV